MRVSLNAVKEFTKVDLSIEELVNKIGAQLGAVDEVIDLGQKYQGIIIVKVVSCEPHPNADKLSVCTIDDGGNTPDVKREENGLVQVVCGAPNVRAGMMAAWLPPGSTVPATYDKEPFVLEAREIRGQVSNGMLASPKELALGDSHEGIVELDVTLRTDKINKGEVSSVEALHNYHETPDINPGDDFAKTYGLDDYIIDIENKMFTHRPDLFGQLGVARELAGILGQAFESPAAYKAPKTPNDTAADPKLVIKNDLPELVPRFVAQVYENITVKPSPIWMQAYLTRVGIRPINNVVDITNYFMALTGQPLHAYDYDKVKALDKGANQATLTIRYPHKDETLTLLNGKTIQPRAEAIMIATASQAIGLGGVMGGSTTEVDENTKTIILECASFDMYSIRRTSMTHGLFTDAVTRFTKGQSPLQNDRVVAWARDSLICDANALPDFTVYDSNHLPDDVVERDTVYPPIAVSADFINRRLGFELSAEQIAILLRRVEFIVDVRDNGFSITAPFWRTDVEVAEDIVEEVGRLYSYDKLPLALPVRDLTPTTRNPLFDLKAAIRERLSRAGANEVVTYSFVPGSLLDKVGQDKSKAYEVSNALSPDLQYYRMSLMPSLLEKVHPNIKAGYDEFALFEMGKTHDLEHVDQDGLPAEFEFTALVVTAADKLKKSGAAYYQARHYLEFLAGVELSFKPIDENMMEYPVVQPYAVERAALVSVKGGEFLGIMGEFKPSVTRALKLPKYTAGFEIDTTVLGAGMRAGQSYLPLFKFPSVKQDITLKVAAGMPYAEVHDFIDKTLGSNAPEDTHILLEGVDIYQKEDDYKHLTFRITITGTNRTLTDKEVAGVIDAIAETAKSSLHAERL